MDLPMVNLPLKDFAENEKSLQMPRNVTEASNYYNLL